MSEKPRVAIIDDDEAVLDSISALLTRRGLVTVAMTTADMVLDAMDAGQEFDCIVSDIRMPGLSGLDVHRQLRKRQIAVPLILITGHGDVDLAVAAMKAGVADFIEKPIDSARLATSIRDAIAKSHLDRGAVAFKAAIQKRFEGLSERQREVMQLAAQGYSNKEMANILKLSSRTVEHYREWVMEKMQARNLADLVKMAMHLDLLDRTM